MIKHWVMSLVIATAICLSSPSSAQTPPSKTLMVAGSGVNLGITKILAQAFMAAHPEIKIDVPGSIGSKGAIKAVDDNAIAIGLLSRPLKDNEMKPDFVVLHYADVPYVVGVHPTVAEDNITQQELVDIYDGKKTKWKDGNDIVVYTREPYDSGILILEEKIKGFKDVYRKSREANRFTVYFTDQESNAALAKTPYAIGFTDIGMIATEKLNIKPLKLDGVEASPRAVGEGKYPMSRPLTFLYRKSALSPEANAFIDFVYSSEGQKILSSNGYMAVELKRP